MIPVIGWTACITVRLWSSDRSMRSAAGARRCRRVLRADTAVRARTAAAVARDPVAITARVLKRLQELVLDSIPEALDAVRERTAQNVGAIFHVQAGPRPVPAPEQPLRLQRNPVRPLKPGSDHDTASRIRPEAA